jgi:hypothetical protein
MQAILGKAVAALVASASPCDTPRRRISAAAAAVA